MLKGQRKAEVPMDRGALAHLAVPGAEFAVRVTPGASRAAITFEDGVMRVSVTALPEDGRANAAVQVLLAQALGVAKTRLVLVRGTKSRDKVFRLEA
jgi:uncharacterized protein